MINWLPFVGHKRKESDPISQPVALNVNDLINRLPRDVLLMIFRLIAAEDARQIAPVTLTCRRWNSLTGTKMKGIERKFASKNNLLHYHALKRRLVAAIDADARSLNADTFFDLAPFAKLNKEDRMALFNKVCPQLKNVTVISCSGFNSSNCFANLRFPNTWMSDIGEGFLFAGEILSGSDRERQIRVDLSNFLYYCIFAVAKVSGKVRELNIRDCELKGVQLRHLLVTFPSIRKVYGLTHDLYEVQEEFESSFPGKCVDERFVLPWERTEQA